jgi:hypothetical protein
MRRFQAAAAAVLTLAVHPTMFAAVTVPELEVVVRVYDVAGLTEADRTATLAVAAASLQSAAIAPRWMICAPGVSACALKPGPGELVLRLVRAKLGAPASTALGDAHLSSQDGGVLATVYVDRVRRVAAHARMEIPTLAGYAIAHELGHLLLSSASHSPHGLMRAHWLQRELQRPDTSHWRFTTEDARRIGARQWAKRAETVVRGTE